MKTAELTGAALDWAVAKCEGHTINVLTTEGQHYLRLNKYSTDWAQGGPIIERIGIATAKVKAIKSYHWVAGLSLPSKSPHYGETPLIAAMRCYVASKLGDTVEIPEGLK